MEPKAGPNWTSGAGVELGCTSILAKLTAQSLDLTFSSHGPKSWALNLGAMQPGLRVATSRIGDSLHDYANSPLMMIHQ